MTHSFQIKPHTLEVSCYGLIVNVLALDVPPPGRAFTTVTEAVPAVLISDEGTVAVTRVLLTKVVVKAELFQCTFELETKCDPLMVSVKAGPPAVALLGEIELIAGTGLGMMAFRTDSVMLLSPTLPWYFLPVAMFGPLLGLWSPVVMITTGFLLYSFHPDSVGFLARWSLSMALIAPALVRDFVRLMREPVIP